jgi:hypothetical protein
MSTVLESFNKIALLAGKVTNTSFIPELKLTTVSELELVKILVLVKIIPVASNVPNPTSNSLTPVF